MTKQDENLQRTIGKTLGWFIQHGMGEGFEYAITSSEQINQSPPVLFFVAEENETKKLPTIISRLTQAGVKGVELASHEKKLGISLPFSEATAAALENAIKPFHDQIVRDEIDYQVDDGAVARLEPELEGIRDPKLASRIIGGTMARIIQLAEKKYPDSGIGRTIETDMKRTLSESKTPS